MKNLIWTIFEHLGNYSLKLRLFFKIYNSLFIDHFDETSNFNPLILNYYWLDSYKLIKTYVILYDLYW